MKKLMLFVLLIIVTNLFSQENYSWSIVDSISKSKDLLYKDTKVFISKTWKSAKTVTEIDDKESGHIMLKCKSIQPVKNGGVIIGDAIYQYSVNFYFKENKIKFTLNDVVYNSNTINSMWDRYLNTLPQLEYPGLSKAGITEKGYKFLRDNLNNELQLIVDSYLISIKKPSTLNENW